jgi:Ni,Fe-hydrogenase I large subunit
LYKFKPEKLPDAQTTSTPLNFNYAIPKDHLLLDLLYEHNRWIHSYHSHDSLLENRIDEGLTADERRRALEEYENLKRIPDPRQMANLRLQQQQQLNNFIAQQHLAAVQQNQMTPALYQLLNSANGHRLISQALQNVQATTFHNGMTNTNRTTFPVPIQPRPTHSNEPITVELDDDDDEDELPRGTT